MRKFLKNIVSFSSLAIFFLFAAILGSKYLCAKLIKTNIPKNDNILVIGTSQLEAAVNHQLIPRTKNMAQSGTCYFYTYQKTKLLLNSNPQIDTLVLGYSYVDISKGRDSWFYGDHNIQSKMRNYFFMFGWTDYIALLEGNTKAVVTNTPRVIINNFKLIFTGLNSLGGFLELKRDKLEKAKELHSEEMKLHPYSFELSENEIKYLVKIYEFCEKKNVQVVLLFTPIHPILEASQKGYHTGFCETYQTQLPNALLVNHSNFALDDSCFSDLGHVNYKGATIYSEYLKKTGFATPTPSCTITPKVD